MNNLNDITINHLNDITILEWHHKFRIFHIKYFEFWIYIYIYKEIYAYYLNVLNFF